MSNFSELLQNAEQLTAEFDNVSETFGGGSMGPGLIGSDLPRVDRSLKQLVEAGQQLFTKTKKDHAGINLGSQDVKASVLLGSRGVDLPGMATRLDTLTSAVSGTERDRAFAPIEPVRDTDVAGFLKNERENAILSVIVETRRDTFENAERLHWESTLGEWETEKQRILNDLAGGVCGSDISHSLLTPAGSSGTTSVLSRIHDSTLGVRSPLNATEMAYASKVMAYNESMVKGGLRPDLVHEFSNLFPEEKDQEAAVIWEMVDAMVQILSLQINGNADDPSTAIKERINFETSKAIVAAAKTYLENSFLKHVNSTVYTNLRQAELGGIPGTYKLVRSYLNVKVAPNTPGLEDGYLDGMGTTGAVPVWPMIYFCLRCGDLDAAIQAASEAGPGLAEIVKLLAEVKGSSDNRLSPHSENVVRISYRRSVRACTDPYKRAVYCLLGACDPSDEHSEVATSLDDYLWIKLAQIREVATSESSTSSSSDTLNLSQLQHLMANEYGETHFNGLEQPVLYFQVLFLTGQFEAACDFLFRVGNSFRSHAVHIALALHESRILLMPSNVRAPLLTSAKDNNSGFSVSSANSTTKLLNVARLVMLYVRKFEGTDPREALHYFYFLRRMRAPTPEGEEKRNGNLFISCVSELVLESREFDLLLGRILEDGTKAPGLIDKFGGDGEDLSQQVISIVAEDSEGKGMFEDSIRLYDLANNHEKVIELLNKLLGQVVSEPSVAESRRDRLQKQAVEIARRYRAVGHTASHDSTAAFFLLLDLMTFFDAFHSQLFKDALDIVSKVKIIPLSENTIDTMVATFRLLTDEVRRTIPDVLLATMNILFTNYKELKETTTNPNFTSASFASKTADGGREAYLEEMRDHARALITFAGMIPYRMPGDTNARLVQMEVLMN
jgi:nuclear pore complex protein Nup93